LPCYQQKIARSPFLEMLSDQDVSERMVTA